MTRPGTPRLFHSSSMLLLYICIGESVENEARSTDLICFDNLRLFCHHSSDLFVPFVAKVETAADGGPSSRARGRG
jgi:hypothetical protein